MQGPSVYRWTVGLALLLFAALSFFRAAMVDDVYGAYTGCGGCLRAAVLANDGSLLAAFMVLLAASRLLANRAARLGLAVAGALVVIAYAVDLIVFMLLTHRLLLADVRNFGLQGEAFASVLRPFAASHQAWLLAAMVAASIAACMWAIAAGPRDRRVAAVLVVVAGVVAVAAAAVPRPAYVHYEATLNLWQVNVEVDPSRAYGAALARHVMALPPPPEQCEAGEARKPSIILVVVESLSAYHSRLFSGLNDFTPEIDALARENSYFTEFHANAYSTETGLIALLTGYVPLPTAGKLAGVGAFTRVEGDFHRWLASRGYRTAFFTSGDLRFGHRDRWLESIGVEYAEGAAQPFYDGMPRGAFGAASDAALVDRFLQWHATDGARGPFMATILTVATHPPYVQGRTEEGERFRATDRAVARLASELAKRGFFRDGVLLVVGDHRAMTPLPPVEREALGSAAQMRVPLIVVGDARVPKGPSDAPVQQADLLPSLRYLLDTQACRTSWQGRFLGGPAVASRYVVYPDPFRRNEVDVLEGSQHYRLLLDGDDSRWIDPPADAGDAQGLLDRVNAERIARMPELARTVAAKLDAAWIPTSEASR